MPPSDRQPAGKTGPDRSSRTDSLASRVSAEWQPESVERDWEGRKVVRGTHTVSRRPGWGVAVMTTMTTTTPTTVAPLHAGKCLFQSASYDQLPLFRGISTSSACAYSSGGQGQHSGRAPAYRAVFAHPSSCNTHRLTRCPRSNFWPAKIPHLPRSRVLAIERRNVGRLPSCRCSCVLQ